MRNERGGQTVMRKKETARVGREQDVRCRLVPPTPLEKLPKYRAQQSKLNGRGPPRTTRERQWATKADSKFRREAIEGERLQKGTRFEGRTQRRGKGFRGEDCKRKRKGRYM